MADELSTGTTETTSGAAGPGSATTTDTPTPITLTETSQFVPPGSDKPVSWKDFQSGYVPKDELTRMRQRDAAERQTWQQTERQRIEQEFRQQYTQQTQTQQQAHQGQSQAAEYLKQLRGLQYLNGEQAATMVEQTIIPLATNLQQMRQEVATAIGLMHQQLQQVRQSTASISGEFGQTKVSSLMQQTKTKLALPDNPIVDELLQDVYHSHQGWETDPQAFETIVGQRWKGIVDAIRAEDRRKADEARRSTAPVRPGAVRPGKPLATGAESADALADRLWTGLQSANT